MTWAIELYQPILKDGAERWYQAKGIDRSKVIEQAINEIRALRKERTDKGKAMPELPKDLYKVSKLAYLARLNLTASLVDPELVC
jgi:hypothetical protein